MAISISFAGNVSAESLSLDVLKNYDTKLIESSLKIIKNEE